MLFRQSLDRCLADADSRAAFERLSARARDSWARVAAGSAGFVDGVRGDDDLPAILEAAADFRTRFRRVVVFGTGGSSLGGQALVRMAPHDCRPAAPRVVFADNADPDSVARLLDETAVAGSGYLVISKSGGTAETVGQLLLAIAAVARFEGAAAVASRITVVTEAGDNPMRRLAGHHRIPVLDHPPDIGGRYSALSVTGLLPAAIAGLDIAAVRAGARAILDRETEAGAVVAGAASRVALQEAGRGQDVLLVYADRLVPFARWWRQLWAESLGKGGRGTTPIDAVGSVDQHSQLQLWLDGPADKSFTILGIEDAGAELRFDPGLVEQAGLDYLTGRALGDVFTALRRGTADSLAAGGHPVRELTAERLDEPTMGALMMHFMLETVLTARLIGVDPFDQPAVEDGKRRARDYLAGGGR